MKSFTSWDQRWDYDESLQFLKTLSETIAPEELRQRHPDFPWGAVDRVVDYHFSYEGMAVSDAIALRQYHALFRKFEPLKLGFSKENRAWETFLRSESACKTTNDSFRAWLRGDFCFSSDVSRILHAAQRKIAMILGSVPSLSEVKLHFGPGATTIVRKQSASATNKITNSLACSAPLVPFVTEVLHELPYLCPFEGEEGLATIEIHNGRLEFVPKDAKTYRAIVVEPPLNGICQLGIGEYIADRLKRHGIDITDQQPNQLAALSGSLTGELATLDLSSASDTVSVELVKFLLPVEWFSFLSRYRSSVLEYDDGKTEHILRLEKFSSMGNGFTFPLETLIFFALTRAACEDGFVRAYGDDIICPSKYSGGVIDVLTACGFSVNREKSYVAGPFRESCGADYLRGINIRPLYVKDLITCADLFVMHNYFKRSCRDDICDVILKYIDPGIRLYGPDGYGDGHLIGDWTGKPYNRGAGWAGYLFDTFSLKPRLDLKIRPGDRILPVYSIYARHPLTYEEPLRSRVWKSGVLSRLYAHFFSRIESPEGLPVRKGNPRCSLPGSLPGYRRISIYTLEVPSSF